MNDMGTRTCVASALEVDDTDSGPIDHHEAIVDVDEVSSALDLSARELWSLWSAALESGDRGEITRFVDASHAIQSAVIALRADGVITTR